MKKNKEVYCHFSKTNLLLVLAWMGVIFCFSSLEGNGVRHEPSLWFYVERKGAHIAEFFILTLLLINLFIRRCLSKKDALLISALIALFYAFMDEIHQLFVFGREGKITDVGFDSAGIAGGIFVVWLFFKLKKLKKQH